MEWVRGKRRRRANRIAVSVALNRYDESTREEVTLRLADNDEWRWQKRCGGAIRNTASGRLAPGVLPIFLRLFRRAQSLPDEAAEAMPRGFWFVRIFAAGGLMKFATGPVTAGSTSVFAQLDEMLEQQLHWSEGVFTFRQTCC